MGALARSWGFKTEYNLGNLKGVGCLQLAWGSTGKQLGLASQRTSGRDVLKRQKGEGITRETS